MNGARLLATSPAEVVGAPRFHGAVATVAVALCLAAALLAALRWLRVAQREHYLPGSVTRFARRWWLSARTDAVVAAIAVAGVVASWWWPAAAVATAAGVAAGPVGLGLRGRTSALAWTRRLRTLAATVVLLCAVVLAVGWSLGIPPVAAAAVALLVPALVDAAAAVTAPLEAWLVGRHVRHAAVRLARVRPTVVAITGSYGKTSTKGHVVQLVAGSLAVVASPASFNNRAGLARAVNENLSEATEVFVAEMGTYGVGEIAELCRWCPPDVAVITAIGPVHLERFGSEEQVLAAKSEILVPARTAVLPVDDPRLAALAERAAAGGKRVLRASIRDRSADVCVERSDEPGPRGGGYGAAPSLCLYVSGEPVAKDVALPVGVQPSNLACAVAVALALGLDPRTVADRLPDLQVADHRLTVATAPSGVTVIDDTYNSNPAGAEAALEALVEAAHPPRTLGGTAPRLVVVTPGMVELGHRQFEENVRFARAVARRATDLIVVGRTNRRALLVGAGAAGAGAAEGGGRELRVEVVRCRADAVAWVRRNLGLGDAVLYENDLPDHYP